jgi:hypothetical protein
MSETYGYHPEVDGSPLCIEGDSAKYRSIIGCCIWIIVLGRFDIVYAFVDKFLEEAMKVQVFMKQIKM